MNIQNSKKQFFIRSLLPFVALLAIQVLLYGKLPSLIHDFCSAGIFLTVFIPAFIHCCEGKRLALASLGSAASYVLLKKLLDLIVVPLLSAILGDVLAQNSYIAALLGTLVNTISLLAVLLVTNVVATKLIQVKVKMHLTSFCVLFAYAAMTFVVMCFYYPALQAHFEALTAENMLDYFSLLSFSAAWERLLSVLSALFIYLFSLTIIKRKSSKGQQ